MTTLGQGTAISRTGVAVALSGGGHRAALFATGALLGVVDAGAHVKARSVASVSGGSLTNGLVAKAGDLQSMDRDRLEKALEPGVRSACFNGLFFTGPKTDWYVASCMLLFGVWIAAVAGLVAMVATIHRDIEVARFTWVTGGAITAGLIMLALMCFHRPLRFALALAVGLLLAIPAVVRGIAYAPSGTDSLLDYILSLGGGVLVACALGSLAVWRLGQRSAKVDQAIDASFFDGLKLAGISSRVHHLFCPTDLVTGRQAYLSQNIVYGYSMGIGHPAPGLRLSTAVQASACFPGGFAPRRLGPDELFADPTSMSPPRMAAFTDGGVYDNMGDQWEFGWSNREPLLRAGGHLDCQESPAAGLIVVNAGGAYRGGALRERGIRFEVSALMRSKDVMYDVTTSVRRRYLVDIFDNAPAAGLSGALIHIGQLPRSVPTARSNSVDPEKAGRAQHALTFLTWLEELDPGVAWAAIRDANRKTPTVLSPLGITTSTNLMHQAYVLTRINVFVLLGIGDLPRRPQQDATKQEQQTAGEAVLDQWGHVRFETYCEACA